MAITNFEQLNVWKLAHELTLDVYNRTRDLPNEEKYGLISQMRRSAVSVPANIAEGFKKRGSKDKVRFYNIAQGSLEELRYYFILCRDLDYLKINNEQFEIFETIGKMLNSLQKKILIT
jgi:four helix bundle protein